MKKLHVSAISILFAVLCLVFTACNQGIIAGNETGTVQVVIGGGGRAVDAAGMPVFDDSNTKITVTDENGNKLAEGTTSVTVNADIGTKITVKAVVTTKAGTWRGSVEHTVTAGTNIVAVKLSKTPKNMGNILSSVISQDSFGDAKVTFKLASGKELLNDVAIGPNRIIPVIARDGIGRIYVLYDKGGRHFTRFDAEGNEDAGFETAINAVLPSTTGIEAITVDAKTNRIFVVDGAKHVYAVTETSHNTFTRSDKFQLTTLQDIETSDAITAMAAYNGELFLTVRRDRHPPVPKPNKLFACTAALSGTTLTLTEKGAAELDELRTSAVMNVPTECTGLFADASGVYCLLREQRLDGGTLYMVGALVCYSRNDNTVTYLKKHPKAGTTDAYLPFDSGSFANPVGFIGYDEENIYIADDGYNIAYLNENWRINGNKNRIAAFNRKTNEITFTDTDATWYGQKSEYKFPNTKILLWEKHYTPGPSPTYLGTRYWLTENGTEAFSSSNKLFEYSSGHTKDPTDVFCYDQDGNLYILWKDGSNHKVRRFPLKEDGSYVDSAGVDLNNSLGSHPISAIAVDISGGQNYLYYTYEDGPNTHIQRYNWNGTSFSTATQDSAYGVHITSISDKIFFTALAANKDGVFVGIKTVNGSASSYGLSVKKYSKENGTHTDPVGTITVGESQTMPTEPTTPPYTPYTKIESTINDLRIVNDVLYAVTSKIEKGMKDNSGYQLDSFKNGSVLYKIAKTASFSGNAEKRAEKNPVLPEGTNPGVGYGFYRFIAVKPKKLVIASDSAWGKDGITASHVKANNNKVFEYDLDKNLMEEKDADGIFSKQLQRESSSSGFDWE